MKKTKLYGIFALVPTIILFVLLIVFVVIATLFGLASGVSFWALIPLFILTILGLLFLTFSTYLSIQLIKNKPLLIKTTDMMANILIIFGAVFFLKSLITVIFNNLSGLNPGAFAQPVLVLLWTIIFVSFGLAIRENNKSK